MATRTVLGTTTDKSSTDPLSFSISGSLGDRESIILGIASDEPALTTSVLLNGNGSYSFTLRKTGLNAGEAKAHLFTFSNTTGSAISLSSIDIDWSTVPVACGMFAIKIDAVLGTMWDSDSSTGSGAQITQPNMTSSSGQTKIAIVVGAGEEKGSVLAPSSNDASLTIGQVAGTEGGGSASNMTVFEGYNVAGVAGSMTVVTDVTIDACDWAVCGAIFAIEVPADFAATSLNAVAELNAVTVGGGASFIATTLNVVAEIGQHTFWPHYHATLSAIAEIGPHYNIRTQPISQDIVETGALGGHGVNRVTLNGDPAVLAQTLYEAKFTQSYVLDTVATLDIIFRQSWTLDAATVIIFPQRYELDTLTIQLRQVSFNQTYQMDAPSGNYSFVMQNWWDLYAPGPEQAWDFDQTWTLTGVTLESRPNTQSWLLDGPLDNAWPHTQSYRLEPTYTTYGVYVMPYGLRVAQQYIMPYAERVRAQYRTSYGIRVAQEYIARTSQRIRTEYRMPFTLTQPLASRPEHVAKYDLKATETVKQEHIQPYSLGTVKTEYRFGWSLMSAVKGAHIQPYGDTIRVVSDFVSGYDLSVLNRAKAQYKAVYSLFGDSSVSVITDVAVLTYVYGGVTYTSELMDLSIYQDESGYAWVAEVALADMGDWQRLAIGSNLTINLYGESYSLVVDQRSRDRSEPAGMAMKIKAISPVVRLESPIANKMTKVWDTPVLASAVGTEIAALAGLSITWNLVDWLIPANRLAATDSDPIDVLLDVINAAGGTLESNPDGSLVVRHLYPVATNKYDASTADHVYTDVDDHLSMNESAEPRRFYNMVEVGDITPGFDYSDSIEFIADEDSETSGVLRVYLYPWRSSPVLKCTGEAVLGGFIVASRTEAEVVEVTESSGRTKYPIFSVTSAVWHTEDLGGIVPELGTRNLSSTSTAKRYSLLDIEYVTRYREYRVSGVLGSISQFILEEEV